MKKITSFNTMPPSMNTQSPIAKPIQNPINTQSSTVNQTQNPMNTQSPIAKPIQNPINTQSSTVNQTQNPMNKQSPIANPKTKAVLPVGKPRRQAKSKKIGKNTNIPANAGVPSNAVSPGNSVNATSPMNLLEFTRKFPDEKACREYLAQTRWAKGFVCPRCGSTEFYFHSGRNIRICKICKHQLSLTSGTIFHKTRVPLQKWFWIIYHISIQKVGISALTLKRMLDMPSYQTVWTICHKIRKAMSEENIKDKNSCLLTIPAIPGISGIIEIDNSYLGATKGKQLVTDEKNLISLNMDIQFTEMKVLPAGFILPPLLQIQNKNQGQSVINQDNIRFKFITNKNIVYNPKLKKKPNKPRTNAQNKNTGGQSDQDLTLHWVSVLVNNLRSNLHGTFHRIGDKHLQRFIDEYCYKFNRRKKPEEIFDRLLSACTETTTIKYNELTG